MPSREASTASLHLVPPESRLSAACREPATHRRDRDDSHCVVRHECSPSGKTPQDPCDHFRGRRSIDSSIHRFIDSHDPPCTIGRQRLELQGFIDISSEIRDSGRRSVGEEARRIRHDPTAVEAEVPSGSAFGAPTEHTSNARRSTTDQRPWIREIPRRTRCRARRRIGLARADLHESMRQAASPQRPKTCRGTPHEVLFEGSERTRQVRDLPPARRAKQAISRRVVDAARRRRWRFRHSSSRSIRQTRTSTRIVRCAIRVGSRRRIE